MHTQQFQDIDKFESFLSSENLTVVLKSYLDDLLPESEIHDMVLQQMQSGGKRFRAMLPLLVAEYSNHSMESILPWAMACEVLHNASLVFDDIQDNDVLRRNQPSAWACYGIDSAINIGCAMLYCAPLFLDKLPVYDDVKWQLNSVMISNSLLIIDGQQKDIMLRKCNTLTADDYYDCVKRKTATLFSLSASGAAIICNFSSDKLKRLKKAVELIGISFQLNDDVIDVFGDKQKGSSGKDIIEGKRSILVVHSLANGNDRENYWLMGILNKPPQLTTSGDVSAVRNYFLDSGSVEYALKQRDQFLYQANQIVRGDQIIETIVRKICAFLRNVHSCDWFELDIG